MRRAIRRLRLREGDIVLVRDGRKALMKAARGMKGIPPCPIVVAPEGVHRLSREYLQKPASTASL